jgi:alcohol dehydrogenase
MTDMQHLMEKAREVLVAWKGPNYAFGAGALTKVGSLAKPFGKSALVVVADLGQSWVEPIRSAVESSLREQGIACETILGASPNAPREDAYRIALQLYRSGADMVVAVGGGSTIDATKAASILATYSPSEVRKALGAREADAGTLQPYFGVGTVGKVKESTGRAVLPIVAVQTAASSASHLTRGSITTDPLAGQKKLISDEATRPAAAVFDYSVMVGAPIGLTVDGGLDGIAHVWEVLTGATSYPEFPRLLEVAELVMRLLVGGLQDAHRDPRNLEARTALGLGTDVAAYAIAHSPGGTHGPHLNSFSLVDVVSHGRACALLNPYYTVLFAGATQQALEMAAGVFADAGCLSREASRQSGRELGMAVAKAMLSFGKKLGLPAGLSEAGATEIHLQRMLAAAKDPRLRMKLRQMPIPMDADKGDVDKLMKPTLEAAFSGQIERVPDLRLG